MNEVWILESGEDYGSGTIHGVYADKDLAFADFASETGKLHARFAGRGIDQAEHRPDGSLHLHAGCDWVSLTPHAVIAAPQIEGAAGTAPQIEG